MKHDGKMYADLEEGGDEGGDDDWFNSIPQTPKSTQKQNYNFYLLLLMLLKLATSGPTHGLENNLLHTPHNFILS
jgi:hypothetical protein